MNHRAPETQRTKDFQVNSKLMCLTLVRVRCLSSETQCLSASVVKTTHIYRVLRDSKKPAVPSPFFSPCFHPRSNNARLVRFELNLVGHGNSPRGNATRFDPSFIWRSTAKNGPGNMKPLDHNGCVLGK